MSPSANSQAPTASRDDTDAENGSDGYPEQRHAGAVGLGPEFGRGVTTGDKIEGYKEELKGKILRKPDVVQHGHDLRTGELKRREDAENNVNPLQQVEEPNLGGNRSDDPLKLASRKSENDRPTSVGNTEQGKHEQAASVAHEGQSASRPSEYESGNID